MNNVKPTNFLNCMTWIRGLKNTTYQKRPKKKQKIRIALYLLKKLKSLPSTAVYACNSSTLGGQGRWITWGQELRPAWPTWWNPISTKNTKKISWASWCMPIVPTCQEAETRESLEPGRHWLQWAEIRPLHSGLGNRARLHLKKNKKWKKLRDGHGGSYL